MTSARPWFGAIVLVAFGAVGFALYSQHVWDMQPCPWCVMQRLIFVAIGAWALVGLAMPARIGQRVVAIVLSLLATAGIATALWHHFVATSSDSCNLTFADKFMSATGLDSLWPQVFAAYASCADARVALMGVPYEFYSLALFVVIDLLAVRSLIATTR